MILEQKHFEYLVLQCGDISNERHDLERWKSAYAERIRTQADAVLGAYKGTECGHSAASGKNRAPPQAVTVLDIGAGLGGLHTLASQAFPLGYRLFILDGIHDPPVHRNSWQTFNNAEVGRDFLVRNGLKDVTFVDEVPLTPKFDLVMSFFAYGFHIHPGNYLADLKKAVHDKTKIILDVRRSKKEWLRELIEAFGTPKVVHQAEKYVRLVFRA